MIRMVDVPVTLHVNKLKTEQVNTNQIFTKNDNYVSNFVFTVKDPLDTELVYSDITSATMTIKLGNVFVEPLACTVGVDNISINIKEQAVAYEGLAVCQLKLFGANNQVYTTNPFTYIVQSAVYDEDKQISQDLSLTNLLMKKMITDGVSAQNPTQVEAVFPSGGTIGQVLTKTGTNLNDVGWSTVEQSSGVADLPSGGIVGQVLVKTGDSTYGWVDQIAVGEIAGVPIINMVNTTATINSGIFYLWGEVEILNISISTPPSGYVAEYMFQFTSGEVATTFNSISGVSWFGGVPIVLSNKTYQASIVNGVGIMVEV